MRVRALLLLDNLGSEIRPGVCVLSSYLDESIRLRQSIHNPSSVIKLNWKKKKKSDGTNEKVLLFYCVISAPAR